MSDDPDEFDLRPETGPWQPAHLAGADGPGLRRTAFPALRLTGLAAAALVAAALLRAFIAYF
jgi:hypothetical protein